MAARTRRIKCDPKTREKIKTTKLLQRLQKFALGEEEDNGTGKIVEMSASQVKAAEILIRKNLPDLTASDINMTQEMPESREEVFDKLKEALGEELALKIAPEFIPKDRVLN